MHRDDSHHGERATRTPRRPRPGRDRRAGETAAPEVAELATRQSVRKGAVSMLVAAAMLLVFNSSGLRNWAHGLPGNAATDVLVEAADRWHATMRGAGLAAAMVVVRDAVAAFRDQGWSAPGIHSTRKTLIGNEGGEG